jgi:uncharacterized surface protein with fasciclin (FAS1) repeats
MPVKRLLVLMTAMVAIAVPAAGAVGASAAMTSNQSIAQIASSDPQLSTLVSLVKAAGLVKALSGSTKLTVFAPTNAAFAALPKATLASLGKDPAELAKVLEYHIIPGVVPAAKVLTLHSAKTLEGARVTFHVTGGHAYINNSKIIKTNIYASNGVVHVINKVLTLPN